MSTKVTVVDGTTYTGVYAADGSINVRVLTAPTTFVGVYAPCGALNVVLGSGVGIFHPSGAYWATDDGGGYYSFGMFTFGASSGSGTSLVALNSRVVYLGDSLIANAPMRSARQMGQYLIDSRLRPGVGCNQGVGGERMDQMFARIVQTTAQAPEVVIFDGGTNDIAAGHSLATMQTNHQSIVDAFVSAGISHIIRWTIPKSTSITGASETLRTDFNTWLLGRNDITVVDLESIYDPTTSDSYDGVHPTWIGARKIAAAEAAVIGPLIAAGSILYADATDATAQGNLETNWDFAGTAGTKSGGTLPTGNVATGWVVTNNTTAAVTCSKTTDADGFEAQQIDITGSASATATVRLTNAIALSPSANPGEFFDLAIQLRISATDGTSPPVNFRGLVIAGGSIANWGSSNPDASAGLVDIVLDGVFRCEPIGLSTTSGSISFEVTVQIPTSSPDIRIIASRLRAVKTELTAYAIPQAITSGKTAPRVTGTVTVGSTLTAENQTWAGGAVTYTYQWQRGTTDIAGATSRTYVIQAGDVGSTLRCVITGSNSEGSTPYTTASTVAVP